MREDPSTKEILLFVGLITVGSILAVMAVVWSMH